MDISTDELRKRIDAKHERALAALAEIESYLEEDHASQNGVGPHHLVPVTALNLMSIRNRVLDVIKKDWASVQRIVDLSGLEARRVRGVINAPGLADRIERRGYRGAKEYRWKQEETG